MLLLVAQYTQVTNTPPPLALSRDRTPHTANGPHTNAGPDGAAPAADTIDSVRHSARSTSTGTPSPADPFALSFGGFRRLMLPRAAEACSKGHSVFYGRGLGAPTIALRKVCHVSCYILSVDVIAKGGRASRETVASLPRRRAPTGVVLVALVIVGSEESVSGARCRLRR